MKAIGVYFGTAPLVGGAPTARSMILITPDGERTMNTYLGACQELSPADIDEATVAAAGITYLEGYLWDPPAAKEAFRRAAAIAHAAGRQVSLTLSDSFCVDRYRDEFLGLIRDGTVDILFANESEVDSLYQTAELRDCDRRASRRLPACRGHHRRRRRPRGDAGWCRDRPGDAGRHGRRHHRRRRSLRRRLSLRAWPAA